MKSPILAVQLLLILAVAPFTQLKAKEEVIQRRFVPPENVETFITRETDYWSEVAMKAIDEGKMAEWSLWQRLDGRELDNSHNLIVINTFDKLTDVDYLEDTRQKKSHHQWQAEAAHQHAGKKCHCDQYRAHGSISPISGSDTFRVKETTDYSSQT